MDRIEVKRALVSVSDKRGLIGLCERLVAAGVEIVSSGGTAAGLADAGVRVTSVADVTGHPEILGGRVKTLHPRIHGGILANPDDPSHVSDLVANGIEAFQLVVTNLYPFAATLAAGGSEAEIIENIDIGGPAMVRAAAKNHAFVGVVTDPAQYERVAEAVESGGLDQDLRLDLARAAFFLTAAYDAAISNWLERSEGLPQRYVAAIEKVTDLRYGENPHQLGARFRQGEGWWDGVVQLAGSELSYLNFFDVDFAWRLVHDLGSAPGAVIVKHANPCGVSVATTIAQAYHRAYSCDPRSAFGGVVALNRVVDLAAVAEIEQAAQADVIVAPGYEARVVERIVARRKNTRVLTAEAPSELDFDVRRLSGGWLMQTSAGPVSEAWRVVSRRSPSEAEWDDARFAWKVCAHVSSNAIVLAKAGTAWGIGAGQQNRVESAEIAAAKADGRAAGGACASDAFYPFPDGIETAARSGVAVVVQPGGALRDEEVIATADRLGLSMIFTGERRFRH